MASSAVDKKKIDELIGGDLESEIMEAKFSLYVASELIRDAKIFSVTLLGGFLNFIHYKCGLVPKFIGSKKVEFDSIGGDFENRSTWVKSLWEGEEGGAACGDPYFLRQVIDQNGDKHEIFVLMDTFSLFECGMILNETRLEGESKFSSDEISKEFHVDEKKLPKMLLYFKYLNHAGRARAHTLVLRPTKLAEMLYRLDDEMQSLANYPKRVLRTEEWEGATSTLVGGIVMDAQGLHNVVDCNEENFRELLKARSIEIPNVQLLTFYEYVQDKLTHEAAKEWEDIRDRYIAEVKKALKFSIIPSLDEEDLKRAKDLLAKARKAVEERRYAESVRHSSNAMEKSLDAMVKEKMPLAQKIDIATKSNPDLRKYREGLHFIRTTRNSLAHANGVDESDEDSAKFALDRMDQFLISIAGSLRSQRFDE